MAVKFLVLQHTPWEGPGVFLLDAARKLDIELTVIKLWEEKIPGPELFDALLILGGTPNIDQECQYPFLVEEKQVIRQIIAKDKPCLGFCLGHQLLADALGARVGPNFCTSIGFLEGHLTHDGREHPAFKNFPIKIPLFKWHGQAVLPPLPKHLTVLATSAECQVEALSVEDRPHILGVQFDNHSASPVNVAEWLQKDREWLESLKDQVVNTEKVLEDSKRFAERVAVNFERFFANFVSLMR